jgi:glutamate/tyrosine decarboxylase-like PLP-dependent enzyme
VTGLASGRDAVLRRAGWDVARDGLSGSPRVRVLVGAERHDTIDLGLRYLGLGAPEQVAADEQGQLRVDDLARLLETGPPGPTMVLLQAGNVHSGAFDPLTEAIAVAHRHDAWVHVDGAFGLWAAASPRHRHLVAGHEAADSWATDAHKTLNVPYDCGLVVVREPEHLRTAMGVEGPYLILEHAGRLEPSDKVLELSRRGRAFSVWAVLRSLGRTGVADLVDRLCRHAAGFAEGLADLGATVRNDVVFTQVCTDFGDDARTDAVIDALLANGTTWMTGSTWHGRRVLRVAVSNWSTTDDDVARSIEAVRRALAATA